MVNDEARTVLIVEDEPIIAMDMADALSDAGWHVIGPAGTLKQAEAAIAKCKPHAALLDISLRGTSTLNLAESLRGEDVPVTFMTGQANMTLPNTLTGSKVFSKPAIMRDVVAHFKRWQSAS